MEAANSTPTENNTTNNTTEDQSVHLGFVSKFGYDGKVPAFRASIIELINAIDAMLKELRPGAFRDTFMEQAGNQLTEFLDEFDRLVEEFDVSDTASRNYQTSNRTFFGRIPLKKHVRGAEYPLNAKEVKLVMLVEVLLAQSRQRVVHLKRSDIVGEYSSSFLAGFHKLLDIIPAQEQKSILVNKRSDKNNNNKQEAASVQDDDNLEEINDDDLEVDNSERKPTKVPSDKEQIWVWFEPFAEQLTNAFAEAKKAQQIWANANPDKINTKSYVRPAKTNKPYKSKKVNRTADETKPVQAWKTVTGGKSIPSDGRVPKKLFNKQVSKNTQ